MGIQQAIQVLEEKRKKRLVLYYVLIALTFLATVIVAIAMLNGKGGGFTIPIILCSMVFLAMPILLKYMAWTKEYQAIYKNVFAREVIYELIENAVYLPEQGFSKEKVGNMGIIQLSNIFSSEDYLQGSYRGVDFELSDILSRHETNHSRHNRYLFDGLIMQLTVPQQNTEAIQIYSKNFRYPASSRFPMKSVKSEDMEFNNMFDVKAQDQQTVFQVLTPQFMDSLKKLFAKYESIGLLIHENTLHLALSTNRDIFDGILAQEINYQREIDRMRADVQSIKDVIDLLVFPSPDTIV